MDLQELRRRRMLTQKELAALVGVSYQALQAWESGQSRPRPGAMRKLVEVLGVTPEELFAALDATAKKWPRRVTYTTEAPAVGRTNNRRRASRSVHHGE